MGDHRDNSSKETISKLTDDWTAVFGGSVAGGTLPNSQVIGSNVLVLTTGDIGMLYSMTTAPARSIFTADRGNKNVYNIKVYIF